MKSLALGLCLSCTFFVPQSAVAAEVGLPAGTAVSVKLADPIDSARDPFGKRYSASVAAPVQVADGETIAAGSQATVVLMRNNSGWIARLTQLSVNGREVAVSSSAGMVENRPTPALGPLQRIGVMPVSDSGPDLRLLLPPTTELRFVLLGSATPSRMLKGAPHSRPAARDRLPEAALASQQSASSTESAQDSGINYLCSAKDKPDRALPTSYYIADVFETSDDPVLVEKHWYEFLVATYPYMFANNSHAIVRCIRIEDPIAERDARNELERESKSENAQIVQTRWHYTLGPPPAGNTSSVP